MTPPDTPETGPITETIVQLDAGEARIARFNLNGHGPRTAYTLPDGPLTDDDIARMIAASTKIQAA